MTLHWWMHWFWVTTLVMLVSANCCAGLPVVHDAAVESDASAPPAAAPVAPPAAGERRGKAIYIQSKPGVTSPPATTPPSKLYLESLADRKLAPSMPEPNTTSSINITSTSTAPPSTEETSTRDNLTKQETPTPIPIAEDSETVESITEQVWLFQPTLAELSEPNLVQASQPEGRTDSAVKQGGVQAGAVAGICLAALVAASLTGSAGFLLYRRRYLNNPQTLNDKCSNPDSSGYLDDSTIRENSEEMYSLDNDSFLNSLEAMTIQNYWTESVKHSKL